MQRALVLASALGALAACGSDREPATAQVDSPVPLVATPPDALRACRRSSVLRAACPSRVPRAPFDPRSEIYDARVFGTGSGKPKTFNFQWGGETPGRPERNRPPRMVHLVLVAGRFEPEFPVHPGEESRNGLLLQNRRVGLDLGPAQWNGRDGRLVLAPPFPHGGIEGNHLLFHWRKGATDYRLSLHAWEPFTETVASLRAIVFSLPPP